MNSIEERKKWLSCYLPYSYTMLHKLIIIISLSSIFRKHKQLPFSECLNIFQMSKDSTSNSL